MNYQVGDTVVHWTHGLGRVIAIDEIHLAGITQQYYVVEIEPIKLFVPIKDPDEGSIRFPLDRKHFEGLFAILRQPGEPLPDNPYLRKNAIKERMHKRTPESLCHLIRDLSDRASRHPLNPDDSSSLIRARKHLVDEWIYSLGIERETALSELDGLLKGDASNQEDPSGNAIESSTHDLPGQNAA
jgi:RNA polymerase-interacting CarD/CdnL/TRCF family regulator